MNDSFFLQFSALSCFILAWPHFLYGAGEEAYQLTEEYVAEHKVRPAFSNQKFSLVDSKPMHPT